MNCITFTSKTPQIQFNSVYYKIHEFFVKKQVTSNDINFIFTKDNLWYLLLSHYMFKMSVVG